VEDTVQVRHYATSREVTGSIPDEVIWFFNWPVLSSRTMALELTQPLTEMSTRNLPGINSGRRGRLTTSPSSVSRMSIKCASTLWAFTACYRDSFTFSCTVRMYEY
jgi:hypothetical protein